MRKFILLLSLFCSTILAVAQNQVNFKMQADGSLKSNDRKDFMVISFEGKTAQDLYTLVKTNVTTQYNSAKDVLSTVENEAISINGISKETISKGYRSHFSQRSLSGNTSKSPAHNKRTPIGEYDFTIQYVISFRFKDGKIRIDAPVIIRFNDDIEGGPTANSELNKLIRRQGIEMEQIYEAIESRLNKICNDVISLKNEDW